MNSAHSLLKKNIPIHLVGIGGIGMSAIAKILSQKGFIVQGSDATSSPTTSFLSSLGIKVFIGHKESNVVGAGLVVKSTAIKSDNPEIIAAQSLHLPILSRAAMIAEISRNMRVLAVTGTHGKTTTTGLLGTLYIEAELDPMIINGGIICQLETNAVLGAGNVAIIEADESDGSFLAIPPDIGIVTNMDFEHLDYYGSQYHMIAAYTQFLTTVKEFCFTCHDHPGLRDLVNDLGSKNLLSYGFSDGADIKAKEVKYTSSGMSFSAHFSQRFMRLAKISTDSITNLELSLFGEHNVLNSLGVLGAGLLNGIASSTINKAFKNFRGIKRRFEVVGEVNSILIVDDYAHHPEEIKATLRVAKVIAERRGGKVIAVVQPHRYTRLSNLMSEFAHSFFDANKIFIAPVYAAGEDAIDNINSEVLAHHIETLGQQVSSFNIVDELPILIYDAAQKNDVVVCMGAGSITTWARELPNKLAELILH